MEIAPPWEERTVACIHEAAHAVVGHRLGATPTFAVIREDGSGQVDSPRVDGKAQIRIKIAARLAEERYCTIVNATKHERLLTRDQCSDERVEALQIARAQCPDRDPIELREEMEALAAAEVEQGWDLIVRFADALDRAGNLSAQQIEEILNHDE